MHVLDLRVVPFKFAEDHLFVLSVRKLGLDHFEVVDDFGQFVRVCLLTASFLEQLGCFVSQLVYLVVKHVDHGLQIRVVQLVAVDHIVIAMLANGTAEADSHRAVFAETFDWLKSVLSTPVWGCRTNTTSVFSRNHYSDCAFRFKDYYN